MSAWLDSLRDDLVFVRQRLLIAVSALAPEDLDVTLVPTLMTPRQQILHVARAEHHWRARARAAEPNWEEPGDGGGLTRDGLVALLGVERGMTLAWLDGLSDDDLARPVHDPAGRELSVVWVLEHLARHDAHHAGQILLLWRWRHPTEPIPSRYDQVLDALAR